MKVASTRGLGSQAVNTAIAGIVVTVAMLTGTGLIPSHVASAQVAGPGVEDTVTEAQTLPPLDGIKTADSIRQPSGLAEADAQLTGARTPTTIRRAVPRPAPSAQPQAAAEAPAGDGWRSARVSWYGPGFYGNTMAGGGTLQPDSMVVAHKSLPFGTMIEFAYNGRTCVAVVADRGPYAGGRVFDLGPGTAAALGFSGVGTVQYRIL